MGYIKHDAVLVTFSDNVLDRGDGRWAPGPYNMPNVVKLVDEFRGALPAEWSRLVVGPVEAVINGDVSYVFLPDGSKEGWPPSDRGDEYRRQFIDIFRWAYDDGSSPTTTCRAGTSATWPRRTPTDPGTARSGGLRIPANTVTIRYAGPQWPLTRGTIA